MHRLYTFLNGRTALIATAVNRRYFTGFLSSDGYLFINENRKILLVDGRYFEAACGKVYKDVEVLELKKASEQIKFIADRLGCKELVLETEISVRVAESLRRFTDGRAYPDNELSSLILNIRSEKTSEETEKIGAAQAIAESSFYNILEFIKPGRSEREISLELDYQMLKGGAEAVSFDTIVVSGENTFMPHGVPSGRKIKSGDFITMDFGAVYEGYHSDMTRTVAVGVCTDEMKKVTILS